MSLRSRRACLRTSCLRLGARPRTLPNRVKWRAFASLRRTPSDDFCNITTDARARPRASDPRPRRPPGVAALAGHVGLRFPPASVEARGLRQPSPFQGKAGSEPRRTMNAVSRTAASCRELGRPWTPLLLAPRARRRPEPTVGCAEDGRDDVGHASWVDAPGAKVPEPLPRRVAGRECVRVPLLHDESSTPWSPCRTFSEVWSALRVPVGLRSPSRRPPRRGASSRQSGCFLPPGNPARGSEFHRSTLVALSRPLVTRPHPDGRWPLRSRGARLCDRSCCGAWP